MVASRLYTSLPIFSSTLQEILFSFLLFPLGLIKFTQQPCTKTGAPSGCHSKVWGHRASKRFGTSMQSAWVSLYPSLISLHVF